MCSCYFFHSICCSFLINLLLFFFLFLSKSLILALAMGSTVPTLFTLWSVLLKIYLKMCVRLNRHTCAVLHCECAMHAPHTHTREPHQTCKYWDPYAKTEGEGLGERVTCVTSGGREVITRGGRWPIVVTQTLRWSASSLPNNEVYWHCLLNVSFKFLDKILQEWSQDSSSGTAPLASTGIPSRLPDVTHVTLSPGPSPSVLLHTVCDQKLEAGTAWERSYLTRVTVTES